MKTMILTLALAAIALLLGCDPGDAGNSSTPSTTRTEQASGGTETPAVAPTASPTPKTSLAALAIGDSVAIDDVTYTVHGVRWGEPYDPPPSGMGTLAIDVSIVNKKDDTFSVSRVLMFKLVDKDGRSLELTNITDGNDDMNGDLAAGRTMRGEVPFIVSTSDTSWDLIIQPEILEDDQAIFTIPAPEK